jgi:hypothetical protein
MPTAAVRPWIADEVRYRFSFCHELVEPGSWDGPTLRPCQVVEEHELLSDNLSVSILSQLRG